VNCSDTKKGAFTGAIAQKTGRFELANKARSFSTKWAISPSNFKRNCYESYKNRNSSGSAAIAPHKVDVRLVAATHRDLAAMVKQGTFREISTID